jgi:hypothetical protein
MADSLVVSAQGGSFTGTGLSWARLLGASTANATNRTEKDFISGIE